jgi:hypothetical protein
MPRRTREDYKKRLDPYDPRTGATGNDDPNEREDAETDDDALDSLAERAGERSSPGSGEDEAGGDAADLQPKDVERGEPAR